MRRTALLAALAAACPARAAGPRERPPIVHGQSRALDLDKPVASFDATSRPLRQAVLRLIGDGLTAGLAVEAGAEPAVTLHLKGATRRQILDMLMVQATGYAWSASTGVVDVGPVSVSTSSPLAALDMTLSSFSCAGVAVPIAVRQLRARASAEGLPVERTMMPTAKQLEMLASHTPPEAAVAVSLASPTLRGALNAIVAADPPAWWLALPLPDGTLALLADVSHEHPVHTKRRER